MAVLFNNIPGNIRVPFFYAEFQPGGTPYVANARLLLPGIKLTAGLATANAPVYIREGTEDSLFGAGSMLSAMARAARRNAPIQEIWGLPVAELSGGVKATGKITISTSAMSALTRSDVLSVYIAGERVRVGVIVGQTAANVVTNLVAAINALTSMPVTAAVNGTNTNECDLTAKWKGTSGNDILLDLGVMTEEGRLGTDIATLTAMASGAGDPDLQTALDALGEDEYDWIASPFADSTNLDRAAALLNDVSGRWSWAHQSYGHYIAPHTGTVSALSTLGNARNDQHLSIFPCRKFRSTPWETIAALGGQVVAHLQVPPELSRPLQTLPLVGIKGPLAKSDVLKLSDRQTLYYDGISGYHVRRDGTVAIDRILTMYQTNAWGDADATYLDIETMAQSMYGIRYLRQKVSNAHPRSALADDNPAGLPHIVTPRDVRNMLIHGYADLVALGVFEGLDRFAEDLVVERNALDANRVDASLPLDHVNQLRIMAVAAVNYMQRNSPGAALAA